MAVLPEVVALEQEVIAHLPEMIALLASPAGSVWSSYRSSSRCTELTEEVVALALNVVILVQK